MRRVFNCGRHGYSVEPQYGSWGLQGPRCLSCEREQQNDIRLRAEALLAAIEKART